ncbi:hypothetical protein KDW_41030 [Dictyobacter vulcani]|uniref:Polyketide synthase n=1 Tax=Dictyobacter vulcani TaxID=2607529 RepID=A0A5J4KU00_9CHLR|nr:SDR family NAD(P)-dependent oxidoreductase [Dictyobacter vulcani]GER89941.1 hypothetical protein KDW_41030 [Dictyobacter vulcani]
MTTLGHKVAELKNFASKLVRGAELIDPTRAATPTIAPEALPTVAPAMDRASAYDEVEDFLRQALAHRLNVPKEQIETDIGYYQMGLDSRRLLEVVQAIETRIGVSLSPILLFEYTTIAELATFLAEHYAAAFSPTALSGQPQDQAPSRASSVAGAPAILAETRHEPSAGGSRAGEGDDIAIIGMAGRYPQAATIQAFWRNLTEGKDCISEIPASRWDWRQFEGITSPSGKNLSRWGGFIDDPDCFDPQFFRISPREAESMDPQERLFLQTCWETIEDAGYTPNSLVAPEGRHQRHAVGVFVGVMHKDYTLLGADAAAQGHLIPLSLNYAQIANRVSYHCNFHGPSMAIDTVCSSSLTAVHLALESIRRGECGVALAGGVNLSLHPHKYVTYGIWDMHSSDGYCHTFGQGGDGYVSAEGIGAVLLKPLQQAELDGDRIYAVIKGSAINHVGMVSGISVPSPVAQADAIEQCLTKTGIHPRTISYVEAHGTGTSLGDPIEIQGLVKAFQHSTQEQQFCAIGSVKSNIGHAESAAGISGLTKVALQLYHRTLVPSLHAEQLNPHLNLSQSPFYVQGVTEAWPQPVLLEDGVEVRYPRRAGLSSLGATGSNAHLILEEYSSRARPAMTAVPMPVIVPLSARTTERLQVAVKNLAAVLQEELSMVDLAYTLQVGREAMEERVVFVVNSIEELQARLAAFEAEQEDGEGYWRGHVKSSKKGSEASRGSREAQAAVRAWREKGDCTQLAQAWAHGTVIDWNDLYGDIRPQRLSLPTYPFARERYWVPESAAGPHIQRAKSVVTEVIHPLLHQNVSDITGLRFSSTFTGQEFFLTDHIIAGQHVLPGVASLEMVRAAIENAVVKRLQVSVRLKNTVWVRPFVVADQKAQLYIRLSPEDNGEIAYEMYSETEGRAEEAIIYVQGSAELCALADAATLNIQALQTSCHQHVFSPAQCYDVYEKLGITYGVAHRGIEKVYAGNDQVLARLSLPVTISHTQDHYVLHPSMLDSALQASIGLELGVKDSILAESQPMLPFALQDIEILGPCTPSMWVYIRYSEGSTPEDQLRKLDFDLCDEQGHICVKMRGFSSRAMDSGRDLTGSSAVIGTLLLEPIWNEKIATRISKQNDDRASEVIICALDEIAIDKLATTMKCLTLQSTGATIDERFSGYAVQAFEEIQRIFQTRSRGNILVQIVVPSQKEPQLLSGLSALLKTAQLENPNLIGQLIEVQPDSTVTEIRDRLQENRLYPEDKHIRYWDNKRYVAEWKEFDLVPAQASMPWKDNGIYLISGGAGGLGLLFAREIAHKVRNAIVILTGRSPLDTIKQDQLQKLAMSGARVSYRQTDMTQKEAVYDLIKDIQQEYGVLNGIIHSAGIIKDNFILKKNRAEVQAVLAPKVVGLVNLDEASKDILLDFFLLFSSGAGTVGSAGQADYAMANAFMNAYSEQRNSQVQLNQRHGRTLSISWPLWKDGGMHVDAETEKMLTRDTGMIPMTLASGMRALYQGWSSGKTQVMVVEGIVTQIRAFLRQMTTHPSTQSDGWRAAQLPSGEVLQKPAENELQERAENYFKNLLSSTIKLPAERIEADAPMENYGIDSIMIMHLNNQLEKVFGSLSKTLFFEYQDIRALTAYFLEAHSAKLTEVLGIQEEVAATTRGEASATTAHEIEPLELVANSRKHFRPGALPAQVLEVPKERLDAGIAIIGVAGRYPQAENILEFWKNLRDGKDSIIEIPAERWDHSLYFDEEKSKPGKTYSKWGGFIADVDKFDPHFFHISPREAKLMDPQERLFLQCVYETLEDAGYTRDNITLQKGFDLGGNVGVYVGVMYEEYQLYGAQEQALGRALALAGNPSSIANRVSYFFNFHGPSMALDTMCSSSLTAIHLACQSLRNGECEVAIAGGVNVSIHPNKYLMLGQGNFVSSKGRCESFGQGGDGYVPGEGVGALLLKPLSKAIEAGDQIYGIIKGTAINHGGKTNGYSVPNPNAQADVVKRALKAAKVHPREVSYIEAHGTGTSLGDPIEITGLSKAFAEDTHDKQYCAIGSAKSNIGHCESAAGIAGITKVLLQLKYGQLAPSLHSSVLNPHIDFVNTPFKVQQERGEWKRPLVEIDGEMRERPRIAGISSFGAGGGNAHIVIEEYRSNAEIENDVRQFSPTRNEPVLIVLSARNAEQLQKRAEQLLVALHEGKYVEKDLSRIAYTLQVGREAMEERLALLVESLAGLEEKLKAFIAGKESIENLYRGQIKQYKDILAAFLADEDMGQTIDVWIRKRKYTRLADLWVKGLHIDWTRLYGEARPRRLSLPAYPFARDAIG